jgi:SAM-dependent methyltransferase
MPSDRFPGPNKIPTRSIEGEKAIVKDGWYKGEINKTIDQGQSYDLRAASYDEQNTRLDRTQRMEAVDKFFLERLDKALKPGAMVYLDFGCATGTHTKKFLDGLSGHPVSEGFGIDISPKMVELAAQALPDFKIITGGAAQIDFENKFDLITSFYHVLGHLTQEEMKLFFENVERSLKPGGILCFDVLKNGLFDEKGKFFIYHSTLSDGSIITDTEGNPVLNSIRKFSKKELKDLAQKNNFEIVELTTPKGGSAEYAVILKKLDLQRKK